PIVSLRLSMAAGEDLCHAPVPGLDRQRPFEVGHDTVPRVRLSQCVIEDGLELLGLPHMDRVDELVLVGEAPVGGADPASGMVGDIVERDLQPVLGEQLTTGDQQPLAIAGGVLAKFRFLHSAILASGYHPSEYLPVSGSLSD